MIVVYDITAEDTLHDIEFWVREIQYYLLKELEDGMPIIFVGNKKDLVQQPHNPGYRDAGKGDSSSSSGSIFKQVQEISHANSFLRPVECSAKTGENVQRIFHTIAHELAKRKTARPSSGGPNVVETKRMCSSC